MGLLKNIQLRRAVRTPSAWLLVGSNLIPLFGAVFLGWNIGLILLIYWLETVIIGIFNIPKLLTSLGEEDGAPRAGFFGRLFLAAFFTIHYGGFNAGHFVFLNEMFDLPPIGSAAIIAALGLALSHGFSVIVNWFGKGEFRDTPAGEQMFKPYGRVVIMHVVILLGGALVESMGAPVIALLLLIALKTLTDLGTHMLSHSSAARDVIIPV